MDLSVDGQLAQLTEGAVDVVRREELRLRLERSLASRVPLVVKVGFDPTAPELHLGHTVLIRKMKQFQDLGHTVVFVVAAGQTPAPAVQRAVEEVGRDRIIGVVLNRVESVTLNRYGQSAYYARYRYALPEGTRETRD